LNRHREELKTVNVKVRNANSQVARAKSMDAAREAELLGVIAVGEAKAEELRNAVARGERLRFDDSMVRQHLARSSTSNRRAACPGIPYNFGHGEHS
jgi:hypothetical protein